MATHPSAIPSIRPTSAERAPDVKTNLRVGMDVDSLRAAFLDHVVFDRAKNPETATTHDRFLAFADAVRDRLAQRWVQTQRTYYQRDVKRAYYLSAEYLLGRALANNLMNMGLLETARQALRESGVDLEALIEMEPDAGLGNGGLGRLAACFLDSLATLGLPGPGYGINYEYGLFTQEIDDGYQREKPDNWLAHGTPWQIERPDATCLVPVYGWVEHG